jgi:hypothetical protein
MRPHGIIAGAALALALAACAREEPPMTIAEVNVTSDLAAIGSRDAVAYWQNLDADLETALAAEFVGRVDPNLGKTINVDVDELSLTNALSPSLAAEDARLAGRVEVVNADGTSGGAYNVTASSQDAITYLPAGSNTPVVQPSSSEFYSAVVRAFAEGTAQVVLAGS